MCDLNPVSSEPWVSVIIVNWNKKEYLLKLLDSLQMLNYTNKQIIVVDNASDDGSVEVIKEHGLDLVLIENKENLGGTGGFNAGMKYALCKMQQQYLWLLDNDAEVMPSTLHKLVQTMEEDKTIGAAGSCIISIEDHERIVEAGASAGWRTGTSDPCLRYTRLADYRGPMVFDVDSVAACSALLRESVIRSIGLMDERYFLHWDDIDLCTRVIAAGFRVVSVIDAPVFHVAEKGYNPAISYYNFRNSLLFMAKFHPKAGRVRVFFRILANYFTLYWYLLLLGHGNAAKYLRTAYDDFAADRYGRSSMSLNGLSGGRVGMPVEMDYFKKNYRILVFAVGSFNDVAATVARIRTSSPTAFIAVAVAVDRAAVYNCSDVDDVITYDLFHGGLSAGITVAKEILNHGFHCAVTTGSDLPLPFAFLVRENLLVDAKAGCFRKCPISPLQLWIVPISLLLGRLTALIRIPSMLDTKIR